MIGRGAANFAVLYGKSYMGQGLLIAITKTTTT